MEKMEKEKNGRHSKKCDYDCCYDRKNYRNRNFHRGEAVYGLGIIGAIVYYFSTATSFWLFVFGFFKAVFWPAFLVYEALKFLHM
jgi:hypothetical protein